MKVRPDDKQDVKKANKMLRQIDYEEFAENLPGKELRENKARMTLDINYIASELTKRDKHYVKDVFLKVRNAFSLPLTWLFAAGPLKTARTAVHAPATARLLRWPDQPASLGTRATWVKESVDKRAEPDWPGQNFGEIAKFSGETTNNQRRGQTPGVRNKSKWSIGVDVGYFFSGKKVFSSFSFLSGSCIHSFRKKGTLKIEKYVVVIRTLDTVMSKTFNQ